VEHVRKCCLEIVSVFLYHERCLPESSFLRVYQRDVEIMKKGIAFCLVAMSLLFTFSLAYGQPAQLWRTGQTTSYAACDDGALQRGVAWPVPRFTDNGDGTITDNLTGLMWLKNGNCFRDDMPWQEALDKVSDLNANAENYSCGGYSAAYNDWRLPNRKELFSLIDFSRVGPALPEGHPFWDIKFSYWSSTTNANYTGLAWVVKMYSGSVDFGVKSSSYNGYVWPVRAGLTGVIKVPTITTTAVSSITSNSASSGGNVTSNGGADVAAKGVCWSTSINPTTGNSNTTDGSGIGSFTSSITGLSQGTTYHVRAYATNSVGTGYGNDVSFTTMAPNSIGEAVDNTSLTWTTGGNANWFGQTAISYYGGDAAQSGDISNDESTWVQATVSGPATLSFYWKVSSEPSYDCLRFYINGTEQTSISGTVDWQQKSYSIPSGSNTIKWAYTKDVSVSSGSDAGWVDKVDKVSITTPTVTTTAVSSITTTTASSGGNVTSDGGTSVTARGVCWSTSANPTISDSHTTDGTGTGPFTRSITGLSPGTTYHVRAYATNSAGTSYGSDLTFTTSVCSQSPPTVTTNAADNITASGARLNVSVNPNGASTTLYYEYGLTTSYGSSQTYGDIGSGTSALSLPIGISGLSCGTTYHFRARATNSGGTTNGNDKAFTTSNCLLPEWIQKAPFPSDLNAFDPSGKATFSIMNKGYVLTTYTLKFWEYDPENNSWTRKADFPGYQYLQYPVFVVQDRAYIISANQVWEYSQAGDSWMRKADIPGQDKRAGFGLEIDGKGYVGGGFYNDEAFWEYDPEKDIWSQKSDLPHMCVGSYTPISNMTFSINGKGYVTGTNCYFWEYDPALDIWEEKAYMNITPHSGTTYGTAFAINDKGYVFNAHGVLYEYDPVKNQWTSNTAYPGTYMCYPGSFSINGKGYVGIGRIMTDNTCTLSITGEFWQYEGTTFSSDVLFVNKDDEVCDGNSPCHTTIQDAINAASTDFDIYIAQGTYDESLVLNESKALTLRGGWDSTFTTQPSYTTVNSMTISDGTIAVDKLVIR